MEKQVDPMRLSVGVILFDKPIAVYSRLPSFWVRHRPLHLPPFKAKSASQLPDFTQTRGMCKFWSK